MAIGGIVGSLLAPRCECWSTPGARLQTAFAGCAMGALLSSARLNLAGALLVAGWIGASLGVLTVTLVTHLRLWTGNRQPLFKVAGGVAAAYFICNYPPLFEAQPRTIALCAASVCSRRDRIDRFKIATA